MQIDDQIKKRAGKKGNKKKEVNIFGNTQEKNENDNENTLPNDEEESDFIIQGKIVDANVNNNNNMNTNVNDQTWKEDTNVVQYNTEEEKPKDEKKKKTAIGWGDNIKSSAVTTTKVSTENFYFPDLNDKNAEKNAPKKDKQSSIKNPELFGTGSGNGNWTNPSSKSDKFRENENAIRFTNAKGNTEKLNKFMQKEGPTYDDTLGDNVEAKEDLDPTSKSSIKFSGKIKIGTEMTEADKQREKYLKEVQERAEIQEIQKAQEKEERQNSTADKPRFINSKNAGLRNNGLQMMGDSNGNVEQEEKRTFTNTKKVNKIVEPEQDPNVPTASKSKGAETKVTLKTWE